MYPFGQDFTYTVTPLIDNEVVTGIPSDQTVTAYVYSQQPTPAQILAGTGYVVTNAITYTTGSFVFTIPAITDPDQNSMVSYRDYWVGVKYILKAGGQVQVDIRAIKLTRAVAHDRAISVSVSDLTAIYPGLLTFTDTGKATASITLALSWLQRKLKNRGYEYQLIHNLNDLKIAVQYRALAQLMLPLIRSGNSQFQALYDDYKETADGYVDSMVLEYDSNKDGYPEQTKQTTTGYAIIER